MTRYLSPESPSATPSMVERMIAGERIPMHEHDFDDTTGQPSVCPVKGCPWNAPCAYFTREPGTTGGRALICAQCGYAKTDHGRKVVYDPIEDAEELANRDWSERHAAAKPTGE